MDGRGRAGVRGAGSAGVDPGADPGAAGRAGVLGTALAGVLAFALSSGSWQWFSTYLGVTLLAVVFAFTHPPGPPPGPVSPPVAAVPAASSPAPGARGAYVRGLTVYSLVVGLCAALAVAPAIQRWAWFFPMPGTRTACAHLGRYAALQTEAALGGLAGRDGAALTYAQDDRSVHAVDDCLAATTTLWLPVYALAAAVLTALGVRLLSGAGGGR
ncbi:hypothetical protein ACIQNG_05695 [Streptomyces sp. NPDC091377]|uniref:hypothetical protein n=1 Tax=Streptomyces sp. NPDC091377 TaxID=3365995 RepID=UPI0037F223C8